MNINQRGNAPVAVIIALAIGVLAGGSIGYAAKKNNNEGGSRASTSQQSQSTDTKPAGLRVMLNNLESEHVDLASAATRAGFDGDPAFQATAAALDKNSNALADAVGSVYGADARQKFYDIWNSHIGFLLITL